MLAATALLLAAALSGASGPYRLVEPLAAPDRTLGLAPPAPSPDAAASEKEDAASPFTVGAVSAGMAGGVLGVGAIAWWDKGWTHIHWNDTGFFGRNTYAGGSDKAGHFYSAYVSMCAMAPIYRSLGISRDGSVIGASLFTLLVWNGFEVIDGFTSYGVEYGDIVANTVGILAGALVELYPTVDAIVGFRLGYVPSHAFLDHDKTFLKFINDYDGMLFYGDLKLKGLLEYLGYSPGPARYLLAGVVYGTAHYSPVRIDEERQRLFGVHVGISLSEVLRAFGDGDEGVEMQARFFDFYAVPLLSIALMREMNNDRWILNFGISNRFQIGL